MNIKEKLKAEWDKTIKVLGLKFDANDDNSESMDAKVLTPDEVQLSDKVIGAKVELVNADGSLSVAPDGNYQLSDGDFAFTVKNGLIASINGQDAPEQADEDLAKVETPTPTHDAPAPSNNDDLQKEVDGLKQELETLKQAIEDLKVGSQNPTKTWRNSTKMLTKQKKLSSSLRSYLHSPLKLRKAMW